MTPVGYLTTLPEWTRTQTARSPRTKLASEECVYSVSLLPITTEWLIAENLPTYPTDSFAADAINRVMLHY
ncbi:MAG: hypothetical protein ACFCD0_10700 [Gemmataceae bacterium]